MMEDDMTLLESAKAVLDQNWLGHATKPAPRLYPHQWSWDSAFIALGYAHYDQERAMQELRSLFQAQWRNGLLPHIVFNQRATAAYFPGPNYWQVRRSPHAPLKVETSGIIQPPIHATAAWRIYRHAADPTAAKQFLQALFPKLVAWHSYLYRERNPDGNGLIYIRHPWESGQDNSLLWDAALQRISLQRDQLPTYQRVDIHEVDHGNRPSDDDYDRYVYLMMQARDCLYDESEIRRHCPFIIQDVLFNALLVQANRDLAAIAQVLDEKVQPFVDWAHQTATGLNQVLWNPDQQIYQNYDWVEKKRIPTRVAAGFSPLYAKVPTVDQAQRMVAMLRSRAFHINRGWTIPSCSRDEDGFCPNRYWRGPVWLNLNWLLQQGLQQYGFVAEAERLRHKSLELPRRFGFYEYFNPDTGKGLGSADFSWTASLVLDLLLNQRDRVQSPVSSMTSSMTSSLHR